MGIDVTHLVLEALGDTNDEVGDEGADGAEGGDVLAVAVVDLNADDVLLDHGEGDGNVAQVLDKLATGSLDRDESRLDGNLDCWTRRVSANVFPQAWQHFVSVRFLLGCAFVGVSPLWFWSCASPISLPSSIGRRGRVVVRSLGRRGKCKCSSNWQRTVLRDLEGLLTVDVTHLRGGLWVRREEVSVRRRGGLVG